jgi:hypothetical protein
MNINEEKMYCYQMMKDITDERRRLSEMYMSLKNRVDELTRMEEKGVNELATKGFFEFFNDRETTIHITNVNRETQATVKKFEEKEIPTPRYDKAESDKQLGQWDKVAQALQKSDQVVAKFEQEQATKEVAVTKPTIPIQEIQDAKEKDSKKEVFRQKSMPTPKRRGQRVSTGLSTEDAITIVENILKEREEAMHHEDLWKKVVEISGAYNLTHKNFYGNVLTRIMNKNPKIIRDSEHELPGFYKYQE